MDGFIALMEDITRGNGLKDATIHLQRKTLTLPVFFRPTKLWDMTGLSSFVTTYAGHIAAAVTRK